MSVARSEWFNGCQPATGSDRTPAKPIQRHQIPGFYDYRSISRCNNDDIFRLGTVLCKQYSTLRCEGEAESSGVLGVITKPYFCSHGWEGGKQTKAVSRNGTLTSTDLRVLYEGAADVEMQKHVQGIIVRFRETGRVGSYPFVVRFELRWVGLMPEARTYARIHKQCLHAG